MTDDQYKALVGFIRLTIEEILDEKLDEKLKYLPTKDDFFTRMDKLSKEIKDFREEMTTQKHQVHRNTKRLDRVEDHLHLPPLDL